MSVTHIPVRNEIIKLVEDLHAAGIILEVLDFAQIRRRSDGKRDLAVVDFEFAMYIDPSGVEAILLDQQMWRLMSYLSVGRE